jgi:hypothetical protein
MEKEGVLKGEDMERHLTNFFFFTCRMCYKNQPRLCMDGCLLSIKKENGKKDIVL